MPILYHNYLYLYTLTAHMPACFLPTHTHTHTEPHTYTQNIQPEACLLASCLHNAQVSGMQPQQSAQLPYIALYRLQIVEDAGQRLRFCLFTCMYACMYVCMYIMCVCVCVYDASARLLIYLYTRTLACMHAYIHKQRNSYNA